MLESLHIKNIILIESLEIDFASGLCVLTGETGAGKSILLDSLGFALGRRATAKLLRHGSDKGSVTAAFDISSNNDIQNFLSNYSIEANDSLFLRRVISKDGKSKAYINDEMVSIATLSKVAQQLIEIHGQNDQSNLFNSSYHRQVLDNFGGYNDELNQTKESFSNYIELKNNLDQLNNLKDKAESEIDYMTFVLDELDKLSPEPGQEQELSSKRSMLMSKDKIITTTAQALSMLSEGDVESNIRSIQTVLSKQEQFSDVIETLERANIEIMEATSQLDIIANSFEAGEDDLEEIEERLFALKDAARKYSVSTDELCNYQQQIKEKLDILLNRESNFVKLQLQVEQAKSEYLVKADKLSLRRIEYAEKLADAMHKELAPLKMQSTKFVVEISKAGEELWSQSGIDKVMFTASTNPGLPLAPLSKIASGGEMSRFMLALKVVLSGTKSVPTLIFDEVDTGIGGAVADSVGRRLELLGKKLQVLVITHQPQVAARGNYHLKVEKIQTDNSTTTSVRQISESMREEELARMLSGENITNEARAAAVKLMEVA